MIGWLVIGTAKYFELGVNCLQSIKDNYKGEHESQYFLFTDRAHELSDELDWITTIDINHIPFPYISMARYAHFIDRQHLFSDCDYLYYRDADSLFVDVGDEILSKRTTVLHPSYYMNEPDTHPYDRNPNCNAYIPFGSGKQYYQNCFQGGEKEEFLKMSLLLRDRTQEDLSNNIIPLWHDESHMNKYMSDNPPTLVLDSGYAFPEGWDLPFEQKILSTDKNNIEIRK
tara:strand:+ start:1225 stop:1908 length:684 start_codon:yes stop_codon:yes gene_type:complete